MLRLWVDNRAGIGAYQTRIQILQTKQLLCGKWICREPNFARLVRKDRRTKRIANTVLKAREIAINTGVADVGVDMREEEVKRIWEVEVGKIRREVKARAKDALRAEVDAFDDAIED